MTQHAENIVDALVDGKITPEVFNHFAAAMGEKLTAELNARKVEIAQNFFKNDQENQDDQVDGQPEQQPEIQPSV